MASLTRRSVQATTAVFPPGGTRAAVGVTGALAVTATGAAAGATGAALPAGRVFAPAFVGLLGGLATLAVSRSRRAGWAGPGPAVAGLGLAGVAAALAAGRPQCSGLRACAWATVLAAPLLAAAWLVEMLHWYQQGRGMLLDGEGGIGVGANLGDAVWWTLPGLLLWALPLGMLDAAAGSAPSRRRTRCLPGRP